MSFPNPIIDLTDGTVDHNYEVLERIGREAKLKDIASSFNTPSYLTIGHQLVGSGLKEAQRTKLRFDRTVEDASSNRGVISVYTVITYPTRVATAAQVAEVLSQMTDFLGTGTYGAQLINQELPA
jgi:hypothetical protein